MGDGPRGAPVRDVLGSAPAGERLSGAGQIPALSQTLEEANLS